MSLNTNNTTDPESKNIHKGHRNRLKTKYYKFGIDCLSDYEKLELLLYYTIPVKDTNVIAHKLLDHFGSLSEIFDSNYKELVSIEGLGPCSASLIKMIHDLMRLYLEDKIKFNQKIMTDELIVKAMTNKLINRDKETLVLMLLNQKRRILFFDMISTGQIESVNFPIKTIISLASSYESKYAIISHNHPSGNTCPSKNDIESTKYLNLLLNIIDVKLLDHIIVSGISHHSLFKSNLSDKIFSNNPVNEIKNLM